MKGSHSGEECHEIPIGVSIIVKQVVFLLDGTLKVMVYMSHVFLLCRWFTSNRLNLPWTTWRVGYSSFPVCQCVALSRRRINRFQITSCLGGPGPLRLEGVAKAHFPRIVLGPALMTVPYNLSLSCTEPSSDIGLIQGNVNFRTARRLKTLLSIREVVPVRRVPSDDM